MKSFEMDAIVLIIREAIDKRVDSLVKEKCAELEVKAKSFVASDAQAIALDLEEKLKRAVAEIPPPKDGGDGQSATPEQIAEAVSQYLDANPIELPKPAEPSQEQISEAVKGYFESNPIQVPEPLAPSNSQIEDAVNKHFDAHPVEVKPDTVALEVAKYLQEHPPAAGKDGDDGKDGLDALQVEILPTISTSKRYAKGTYAKFKGGIVRAFRDTDAGDDLLNCGWDVVVNGVDEVQIHQLEGGEFAIKSLMTNGQSHIVKATMPTMEYKGVWKESFGEYAKGHTVTQNGSLWHCNRPTADKPGTSDAWTLCAKRGADGKDLSVVKMQPEVYKL